MCLLAKRTFVLSSQKELGINLQAASTVIERRHCSTHLPRSRAPARRHSVMIVRACAYLCVRLGALVSPHVREKLGTFHEMKGDRDGKSAKKTKTLPI